MDARLVNDFPARASGLEMSRWQTCLKTLEKELQPQQFSTWIQPLQAVEDSDSLELLAPNRFVADWVKDNYLAHIEELLLSRGREPALSLSIRVGSNGASAAESLQPSRQTRPARPSRRSSGNLNANFTFNSFVEGKSNQLARAAALQVAENPGKSYNPLFIYGGVGLGKTHLMHAIGHAGRERNRDLNVAYLHSEMFVADLVKSLQRHEINQFKHRYRSLDVLLIDDVQFFAGKEKSQEEFFHTFNTLLEGQNQVVLTCDRFPKEIDGIEERLKSRFSWGLTVAIDPPELETRVAIIKSKAETAGVLLPDEAAFFIAERFSANVRELEGALNRVIANANMIAKPIDIELCKQALRDMLLVQDRQISLENIQKTVAQYYRIKVADLLSKKRSRSIARPRQMAMTLAKELTSHSLPEIGDAFGGRDHTTVLHACRRIAALRKIDSKVEEEHKNLSNILAI